MTGFGDAACQDNGVHYAVEVRSVNNKYFKASFRMPDEIAGLEPELEVYLRKRLTRGSVTLTVDFRDKSARAAYELNEPALGRYLSHLRHIEQQTDPEGAGRTTIDLASMLVLPGVIQPPSMSELVERCRPVVMKLLDEACDKCLAMRQREGAGLLEDLMIHRRLIAERLEQVRQRVPDVLEEYHQRLRTRIDELMARAEMVVENVDLVREVAIFADRCDVAEEVQRLDAHLDQFEQIIHHDTTEPAGRTLDFLTQEMLREANTIASKSNDAQIARIVVEVKGSIDRIKEQVQNVE
ncbi:MAG: YicC family protein [Planctomycetaceae bacterium]|nr:YicC family protein [Planctomycetaceae bacterium]